MSSTPTVIVAPQKITNIKDNNRKNEQITTLDHQTNNSNTLNRIVSAKDNALDNENRLFNPFVAKITATETSPPPSNYATLLSMNTGYQNSSKVDVPNTNKSVINGMRKTAKIENVNVSSFEEQCSCKHSKIKPGLDSFIDVDEILKHKSLETPIKAVIKKTSRDKIQETIPSLYPDELNNDISKLFDQKLKQSDHGMMDVDVEMKEEEEEQLEEVKNLDIDGRKKTSITKSPSPAHASKRKTKRYTFKGRDVFKIKE